MKENTISILQTEGKIFLQSVSERVIKKFVESQNEVAEIDTFFNHDKIHIYGYFHAGDCIIRIEKVNNTGRTYKLGEFSFTPKTGEFKLAESKRESFYNISEKFANAFDDVINTVNAQKSVIVNDFIEKFS